MKVAAKERPILFSAPMVRALLDGSKTQTRRTDALLDLLAPGQTAPKVEKWGARFGFLGQLPNKEIVLNPCRFGGPGDRLWVRETFKQHVNPDGAVLIDYREAGGTWIGTTGRIDPNAYANDYRWRPSIHMPRWASRLTLEIVEVRVERLQDIGEEDAKAEGCRPDNMDTHGGARDVFIELWESINGPGSWDANPWVWVIEFKRITPQP